MSVMLAPRLLHISSWRASYRMHTIISRLHCRIKSQPRWLSGLRRSRVHSLWLLVDHCVLRNWDRILVRAVKGLISRAGMVSICPLLWQRDVKLQQTNCRIKKIESRIIVVDDSRNGVFVNNIKIDGQADLTEGDVVIMGHPNGERLAPGTRVRQPDSEYQYIVSRPNRVQDIGPIVRVTVMYFWMYLLVILY